MARASASVLGQAAVNVAGPMNGGKETTHWWTWGLLGFFIAVLVLHYWGAGGLKGSVAS